MSELEKYRSHIESLTEKWLRPYLSRLDNTSVPRDHKVFNDVIWGSIVLYPFEILLLDSPVIQRLRRIRQLGVVHWVYPSATHSRLEHTLGVVHVMQQLIDSINTPREQFVDQKLTNLMRLAALCHDVGHGVMSHVSENALRNSDSATKIRMDFADQLDKEPAKLSEVASYYIVGSPAFRELFSFAENAFREHKLPNEGIEKIQKAIVASPISNEIPMLHELMNGPFDADKLDYMPRDAHMCGVPVVTDIPRLIRKIRCLQVTQDELPQDIAKTVRGGLANYTVIGVDLSGGRTLDELMLGRSLLFDKVYRHHKVRAAEAMVASILLQIKDIVADMDAVVPLLFADDQLLDIDEPRISQLLGRPLDEAEKAKVLTASDLAERLKSRRLPIRGFAFAQKMPLDPYGTDSVQRFGLEQLQRETQDPVKREQVTDRIAQEVKTILGVLGQEAILHSLQGRDLKSYIWLSPPETPTLASDVPRAYLIAPGRKLLRFRDDAAETRGWADAYLLTRDTGYVFAPAEFAPFVYLATEKVVREFGVRIPSSMTAFAKQSTDTLENLREVLDSRGYYKSFACDLRPMPGRLKAADVQGRLQSIVSKLAGYCGPSQEGAVTGGVMSSECIRGWLRQFETADLVVDAALRVVEHVRLIGRNEIKEALEAFIKAHPEFGEAFLCQLGHPKDSSAIVTYYAKDVGLKIATLPEALAVKAPVMLVDDFIGTGHQAVTILENWLGLHPSFDLKEERGEPLAPELQAALKKRPLGFVFASGTEAGADLLQKRTKELEITAKIGVHIKGKGLPRAFGDKVFESDSQEAAFRGCCEQIGLHLLLDPARGHDEEWVKSRVLGYGNQAYLVVFPYNTPAQSLTCLWATGNVNAAPWIPLFPRRPKG